MRPRTSGWRSAKYCLQQSGVAPEVTELIKAQSSLWHRQVQPATPCVLTSPTPSRIPRWRRCGRRCWRGAWPGPRPSTAGSPGVRSTGTRCTGDRSGRDCSGGCGEVHGVALSWLGGGPSYPWRTLRVGRNARKDAYWHCRRSCTGCFLWQRNLVEARYPCGGIASPQRRLLTMPS